MRFIAFQMHEQSVIKQQVEQLQQMQEQDKLSRFEAIKPLPVISHRKLSSQTEQLPRCTPKNAKSYLKDDKTETTSETDKLTSHPIFAVPKDTFVFKKRVLISPTKFINKKRLYETLESDLLKKQIEELRKMQKEGFCKDEIIFSSALRQFGLLDKEEALSCFKQSAIKPSFYQPSKKKSVCNQRDRLKPITSETHIKNDELQFLNVEKMMLIDMAATKKSLSLNIKASIDDSLFSNTEKEKPFLLEKSKGKACKETNAYKSRIQKGFTLANEDSRTISNEKMIPFNMNIKTIEVKLNSIKNEVLNQTQVKVAEQIEQEAKGQVQYIKKQRVLHYSSRKQSKTDKGNRIGFDNAKQTQNLTPTKKNTRKINIPFETYYYRDLIWKVNFSNNIFVEIPLQYEHRLKIFVGKGNNSCMVNGLIARRPWFAFTDKIEEANFVWTQLKRLDFFKKQKNQIQTAYMEKNSLDKYIEGSILTQTDSTRFKSYLKVHIHSEEHCDERMLPRAKSFKYGSFIKIPQIKQARMHNHLINNYVLGNKKALFNTMTNYYNEIGKNVFDYLPLTFHIKEGMQDKKYFQFLKYFHKRAKETVKHNQQKGKQKEYNAWIVKPGENSNRGNGIKMCLSLQQIKAILKKREKYADGSYRTYIVQAYIERPLLYNKRKFDIRHYMMMTCVNGIIKGYWYKHGYVRTTSSQYSLASNNGCIHLTNDAVQKNLPDYGKYQKGNKISYDDLSAYIDRYNKKEGVGFYQTIYPRMKSMAADAMKACSGGIDPKKLQNNFEIFGMDFMIDSKLDVWLIQINTNPCLELSCSLLGCIIPKMVENALELTLDAMFPPPVRYSPKGMQYLKQMEKQNKFQMVYDQRIQKLYSGSLDVLDNKLLQQQDDTFQDCGDDWQDS